MGSLIRKTGTLIIKGLLGNLVRLLYGLDRGFKRFQPRILHPPIAPYPVNHATLQGFREEALNVTASIKKTNTIFFWGFLIIIIIV